MRRFVGALGSMMVKSTQYVDSLCGSANDGVHEFVVRGGDAGEVNGDVVVWLEGALAERVQLLGDRDQGVVAGIAKAGSFGAVVIVEMGPVVHVHGFLVGSALHVQVTADAMQPAMPAYSSTRSQGSGVPRRATGLQCRGGRDGVPRRQYYAEGAKRYWRPWRE